jgi:latrophilin 2
MFLVVFAWLMNEAFNLYITITYAAHQSGPLNDQGSQWRFYLLGWLMPFFIVIVMLLSHSKTYYDEKICWFNLQNLWINISPMISMVAVSALVMIFSAKEHSESSYTKTAKANKLIT